MPYPVVDRILVYGRVRPPASPDTPLWVTVDKSNTTVHCGSVEEVSPKAGTTSLRRSSRTEHVTKPPSFILDGVVDAHDDAAHAFFDITVRSCVVDSVLKGTSATVLCCGEKGTGKTTTMFGDVAVPGLCQRLLASLFAAVTAQRESSTPMSRSALAMTIPTTLDFTSVSLSGAQEEEARCDCRTRYSIELSCLALCGEHVVDLLAEAARDTSSVGASVSQRAVAPSPSIPSSPSFSARPTIAMDRGKVVVRNVSKVTCRSAADAFALIDRSRRAQSSAASPWVAGHVVVMLDCTCEEGEEGSTTHHLVRRAQLYLVDLAAAEQPQRSSLKSQLLPPFTSCSTLPADRAITPPRGRGGDAAIRHSLAILKEVITRLSSSSTTVDDTPPTLASYKRSKLTMLLKGHLGGGCRTLVIAHVRPEEAYKRDTLATLQLARRLLCVPEQLASRVAEDPFVRLRQLQRQVMELQAELRLQMELKAHTASNAPALATTALPDDASTDSNANVAKKHAGAASAKGTQQGSLKSSTGRVTQRCTLPLQTPGNAADDFHPLLRCTALSSATPASAALTTGVMNFVAGRVSVLPVTTVLEMHTCFELLRQCVAEKDIQLSAALADLRAAEAAAAAAFTVVGASGTRRSVSERCSGKSFGGDRFIANGGIGRRRMFSMRSSADSMKDTPTAEGKCRPSVDSALSTATVQLPSLNSLHTKLLREPSPSALAPVDGKVGRGYGSAPSAAGSSQDVTQEAVLPFSLPGLLAPPPMWHNAVDATVNALPAAAAVAPQMGNGRIMSPANETFFASAQNEVPSSSLRGSRVVSSAPVSRVGRSSAPNSTESISRQVSTAQHPSTQRGRALADALAPSFSIAAHSTMQVLRPHSATPALVAHSVPPASPRESSAFHVYTTQTAEGVKQVEHVRMEKEALANLRLRLVALGTGDSSHNSTALADECRYHESQLTRRREALLRSFESWHRARAVAEDNATSVAKPLRNSAGNSTRLTLDTMRQRLRRPAPAGHTGGSVNGGSVGKLRGGTTNGVEGSANYGSWSGLVPVLSAAASFSPFTKNEAADEVGVLAVPPETFSAAGAPSTAY
ncbi:Kinesin motor domain containing protein, putative [Leishmania guyanensis]|uniref:Kinesin motor domain-containing protein n=2 Tax=Leishmania guyanensis species complex TaxID=38579 RepID=A0A1E1IV94_LEIGU